MKAENLNSITPDLITPSLLYSGGGSGGAEAEAVVQLCAPKGNIDN